MKNAEVLLSSETFYMDSIVNKYIFFNLYVHSHLKYTHLVMQKKSFFRIVFFFLRKKKQVFKKENCFFFFFFWNMA